MVIIYFTLSGGRSMDRGFRILASGLCHVVVGSGRGSAAVLYSVLQTRVGGGWGLARISNRPICAVTVPEDRPIHPPALAGPRSGGTGQQRCGNVERMMLITVPHYAYCMHIILHDGVRIHYIHTCSSTYTPHRTTRLVGREEVPTTSRSTYAYGGEHTRTKFFHPRALIHHIPVPSRTHTRDTFFPGRHRTAAAGSAPLRLRLRLRLL